MKEVLPLEDKELAFSYIIMNLLVASLDRDIEAIRNSTLKLKNQHVFFLEELRNQVIRDHAALKKELFRKGIKVFDMTPVNEDFVSYKYVIRGYESEFRCFKAALKNQTGKKFNSYLQNSMLKSNQ